MFQTFCKFDLQIPFQFSQLFQVVRTTLILPPHKGFCIYYIKRQFIWLNQKVTTNKSKQAKKDVLQRQNENMKEEAEEMLLMTFVALRKEKGRKRIQNI